MKNEKRIDKNLLIALICSVICVIWIFAKLSSQVELQVAPKVLTESEKIDKQFDGWDGSHIKLKKIIKKSMGNSKSFEHIETTYWEIDGFEGDDDYIIVLTNFRGKNMYGGVVQGYLKAKFSIDGELLEIIENG